MSESIPPASSTKRFSLNENIGGAPLPGHGHVVQNTPMPPNKPPFLVVFSGLPGTGKTTISKALAGKINALYLRIDTIEQAMKSAGTVKIGAAGYAVANALAEANLLLGHSVVADCVNPVLDSRHGWLKVAAQASTRLVNIQLICSDTDEHRRRVEERCADISGHVLPTWDAVMQHEFEAHDDVHLILDTAVMSPAETVDRCQAYLTSRLGDL
jgi:predicted kinase